MLYRKMPDGKELSLLGFGAMRLPVVEAGKEDIDEETAAALIDYALAHGVNYFDTAWPYHEGTSESFLGRALVARHPRDSFYLTTKLPVWEIESTAHAEELFAKQLVKLQTDHLDYYLMHALDGINLKRMNDLRLLDWALEHQQAGRIRKLGFSFHGSLGELERIVAAHDWDVAQIQLNYLDWDLQDAGKAYELLAEAGLPIIVMEPVRGGVLAKLNAEAAALLEEVHPDKSIASWALRYVAALPQIVTVLSGMSTMEQLVDNVATFSLPEPELALDEREMDALTRAIAIYNESGAIGCTACRYCMPCPHGVDIPRVFGMTNQFRLSGNAFAYGISLQTLAEDAQADCCTACEECLEKCPQDLDIPRLMADIVKEKEQILSVDDVRAARAQRIAAREV